METGESPRTYMRIAALDDDPAQLELIRRVAETIGLGCHGFGRAIDLQQALRRDSFDLLVVDWILPDLSGPEVVQWVRRHVEHDVPVLFVTALADERDIVEGLSCGADDYLTKPIRAGELIARVRALLRRSYPLMQDAVQTVGRYRIDRQRRVIEIDGEPVPLQDKEFDLADCLFSNVGRLLSREHLLEAVWGTDRASWSPRAVDTCVSKVRKKLRLRPENGFRLGAVQRVGYRLMDLAEQEGS
jgi:DNA-binding response OmpR family regulator